MRLVFRALFLLLVATFMFQPARAASVVSPNVDIAGDASPDRQRVEPTIAVNPRNPLILAAGAQDLRLVPRREHRWHGYYRSTDGGLTWSSALVPGFPGDNSQQGKTSPLSHTNTTSDPVMAFDADGNLYYAGLSFNLTSSDGVGRGPVFVAKYVNDGRDYSGTVLVPGTRNTDKPWIAVDMTSGPNRGNVYIAFDGSIKGRFTLLFTRSTNGGSTFSLPERISNSDGSFPGVTVDPTGRVFVSSMGPADSFQHIKVFRSTDAGTSFVQVLSEKTAPLPLRTPLPGNGFRVGTVPQIASDSHGIYVVYDSFAGEQANILLERSTDGGRSWSIPIMVNEKTSGEHFFPTISAYGGVISVAWYDSRLGQLQDGTITAQDVFYSQSTDGGATFSKNLRVTTTSFDPNLVKRTDAPATNNPFIGDYISIATSPGMAHPIWTDNRDACDTTDPHFGCVDQDAFTATISTDN